ncbi:hypothetical protein B7463_g12778, partial [Scytalidium lignicola]
MTTTKPAKQINFLRGWPHPSLLPVEALKRAANNALDKKDVAVPALLYGPDPGYQPLREQIASWLGDFYSPTFPQIPGFSSTTTASSSSSSCSSGLSSISGVTPTTEAGSGAGAGAGAVETERIVITGGASQNLACACQVFSDPVRTLRTWMVAPSYFLAGAVFGDNGLVCAAAPEGRDGV